MKRNITSSLPGLVRHTVSENLPIILDVRKEKTRYIGVICQIPFGYGYMLCPFVHKHISSDIPMPIFPKRFKNTNKSWDWCEKQALAWKDDRRYTIFNILILWFGLYGRMICAAINDTKIHMALMQLFISIFLWFYAT